MRFSSNIKKLTLCLLTLLVTSCSLSQQEFFLGSEASKQKVQKEIAGFHKAIYWKDLETAMSFVHPSLRREYRPLIKTRTEKERMVEFSIDDIAMDIPSETASVEITQKYYEVPKYIVKTRREQQVWRYNAEHGIWHFNETVKTDTM